MRTVNILNVPIAAIDMDQAVSAIADWVARREKAYVTVTGVHGIMESQRDPRLLEIHRRAGMCVPDGMPTVLIGRWLYRQKQMRRVYGPDLMLAVMRRSVEAGWRHFFYGGKEGVPELLRDKLCERFPGLNVAGVYAPPFRPLNEEERRALKEQVDAARPDILWVGLSTPKQELWMAENVGNLNASVMVGVGAAFDFHAGLLRQAPAWMQRASLEWLFRLYAEPRRLWRRYLRNNPEFLWLMFWQLIGLRKSRDGLRSTSKVRES